MSAVDDQRLPRLPTAFPPAQDRPPIHDVSMKTGATAFARTGGASAVARVRVSMIRAAFDVMYLMMLPRAMNADVVATFTILPKSLAKGQRSDYGRSRTVLSG
jgi:hypothetical protein